MPETVLHYPVEWSRTHLGRLAEVGRRTVDCVLVRAATAFLCGPGVR